MGMSLDRKEMGITARRREKKEISDFMKRNPLRPEVDLIFNTFYRKQVTALYREVWRTR